jgi:predicted DNA-binding WGR domain protein
MTRRFEFIAGFSCKFWEISFLGDEVTVNFGRIGTTGQSLTKSFPSADKAKQHAEKLMRQKLGKGYVECVAT